MHASALAALAAAALTGLAHAQSESASPTSSAAIPVSTAAVPGCALTCVLSTLPNSPCASYGISNLTCICTSSEFQLAYFQCQQSTCSEQDLTAAEQYGAQSCEQNGTPINISQDPSGFTSSGASSTSAAGSSASTSGASSSEASTTSAASASGSGTPSASGSTGAPAASASGSSDAVRSVVGGAVGALAAVAGLVVHA
ncbi:hypothetical protein DMC30DRAFT_418436 [Rhodotorula diobovata]|uniref:CFEM domain-containing protein n=1 Tax=Rhodotorula diobovata TaxID=5288 RepID=A0A5C5FPZ8_9BASI|nr:hypothetical protein DMC30DRAFT_418436 [Rhodotorula diobovata]